MDGSSSFSGRRDDEQQQQLRSSSAGPSAASGADAVRARREKMEMQRKKALEEALGRKALPRNREDEIKDLEQQLATGKCSAAAASGVKKRILALRATSA